MEARPIDYDGRDYPYQQLAAYIAGDIDSGVLPAGKRVPSESAMIQRYGVARDTARRAVKLLREQGYVETIPHRGTFVLARGQAEPPK